MNKEEFRKNQPVAYRVLSHVLKSNSLSHAYLLSGAQGAPLSQCALLLAQSVLCENPDEDGLACQKCTSCQQVERQEHPDFFKIGRDSLMAQKPLRRKDIEAYWKNGGTLELPEIKFENYTIKKDQIARLQDFFSKSSSSEKGRRVYILEDYDRATVQASNSLLKFLEEPPEDVIGILTSHHLSNILDTIQSRTQIISLRPAGRKIRQEQILELIDDEKAAALLADHGFDQQDTARILRENRLFEMQEAAEKFLEMNGAHKAIYYLQHEIFPFKNKEFNRMDFQLFLYWISFLSFERKDLSLKKKLDIQTTCLKILDQLKTPADAALLLDRFCFYMHEIF